MKHLIACAAAAAWLGLTACTPRPSDKPADTAANPSASTTSASASAPEADPTLRPTATLQEIMNSVVDPAADALWATVGTVATQAGVEERAPKTDEEWLAARQNAIRLIEGSTMLLVPGRLVAHPHKQLEDAHVSDILKPEQVQALVDGSRDNFIKKAHALHDTGTQALAAIDAKDAAKLMQAGDAMDKACESCHITYWYPNEKAPPHLKPDPS